MKRVWDQRGSMFIASPLLTRLVKLTLFTSVLILAFLCITVIYNLYFHPLRSFPGPRLARITRLWARIGNFYGRKSERVHAAHLKYGPVVRVGPNELSFADPRAVKDIYASPGDVFVKEEDFYITYPRSQRAKRIFHENHMMSFRDPSAHKARRKLLSRGFSQSAMLEFESNMSGKIETMLNQWARLSKDKSKPINVFPWVHWLGFDIVYNLMFDEDPGTVRKGQPHEVMPYLKAWRPTFIYKEFIPQLEQWGPYVPGYVGGYFRDVQAWKDYAVNIIVKCRERGTKTPFLRGVLAGDNDTFLQRPLNDSEIAEECMGGMFGGSGTTANTFVYLLWACLRRPDVALKLKDELVSAFSDRDAIPEYKDCSQLPYLQAVINETLRRYPTIVATLPRTAKQETVVAGVTVPAGTIVGTQNYTMHRNEKAFANAEDFEPERWLQVEKEDVMKESFTPFSVGSRKCVGINLAQMELTKVVASFFRRFEGSLDAHMTEEDMRMYDTFSAAPAGGKLLVNLCELGT